MSQRFTHEGCGVQNFYRYNWKTDRTYAALVRVRPEVVDGKRTGATLYTSYFRIFFCNLPVYITFFIIKLIATIIISK